MSGISHDSTEVEQDISSRGGRNVLLLGPSLHGNAIDACHDLRTDGSPHGQTMIYLLFTRSHVNRIRRMGSATDSPPTLVIEAVPNGGSADFDDREEITVEAVSSPANLTDIGIALNRHLPDMDRERIVVCVRSLTALLQYVDVQHAYRFLNTMTNQLASYDALACYHLDPSAHDERVVTTLSTLFDRVVEVDDVTAVNGGDTDVLDAIERFTR